VPHPVCYRIISCAGKLKRDWFATDPRNICGYCAPTRKLPRSTRLCAA